MTASVARERSARVAALDRLRAHAPEAVVAAAAGIAAVLLYVEGRGTSFFFDEWNFVLERRENDLDDFLSPHNGHLSVLPIAVYRLFFELFGLEHYAPYRLLAIVLHLVCAVLFFLLVRRRIDRRVAALATVLVLFLGTAWQDLLWPFQIGFLGSIAAGLGALLVLEREDRRGDIAAACLLVVGCACSGLGIPFLLAAAMAIAWTAERSRRAWVVLVPAALFALWYVAYGESEASFSNVRYVPAYVADSLAGALGAISGLGTEWGRPLAVAATIVVLVRLFGRAPIPRQLAVIGVAVLSFWTLTALTRGALGEPDASRYLYPGAILLLLAAVELTTRVVFTNRDLVVLALLVAAAVTANLGTLRDGAGGLRGDARFVGAELAAVELLRSVVPDDYRPDPNRSPVVTAGPYLDAVDALGSPATPVDALAGAASEVRTEVDRVFAEAGLRVEPGPVTVAGALPDVEPGERRRAEGSCVRMASSSGGTFYVTTTRSVALLPSAGTSVQLAARRLGDVFSAPVATIDGRARIQIPADGLAVPWRLQLSGSGPFAVCGTA